MDNQVIIKEKTRTYDVKLGYHSDLMCENYDAEIIAAINSDGRVTFSPKRGYRGYVDGFIFDHSDPDRVIAITRMMQAFAEMAKNEKKTIDISNNA